MNRSQLFKVSAVLLTGLLMVGMAGCGTEEAAVAVAPAPPPAPPPPPPPEPMTVDVPLGALGGSITLTQTDTGYTRDGEAFASGTTVTVDSGDYVVTMTDGVWAAVFQETMVTVKLGTSGSMVTIEVAEDGSFSIGSEAIVSGATVSAENGNVYVLTMADGAWVDMFQSGAAMQIANTPVNAVVGEDGMYAVVGGEGAIGEDGTGMVSSGGLNYRVMMDGDALVGTLYDMVGEDASWAVNKGAEKGVELALSADDEETDMDESGTMLDLAALKAGGDSAETAVSLGSLFDGSNAAVEETFIAGVVKDLNAQLALLEANIGIGEEEADADSVEGMERAWAGANEALLILGLGADALGDEPNWDDADDYKKKRAEAVTTLEEAIAALDSQEAFTAALGDEGVLSVVDDKYDATKYSTVKSSADISFDSTANTRFGVVSTTERTNAGADITSSWSKFAWSPLDAVTSAPFLEKMSATYLGQTTAVTDLPKDSKESPEFISGDIELTVRLDTKRGSTRRDHQVGTIEAVVSNLQDSEGNTFNNGEGDVESIELPDTDIMDSGDTVGFKSGRADSTVKYADRLEEEDLYGAYEGNFVGDGATDEDVPLAAIGLWHLWTEDSSNAAYRDLVGSWGAELSAVTPDEAPPVHTEEGDAFSNAALARMRTIFDGGPIVKKGKILNNKSEGPEQKGIVALADLIAAPGDVKLLKDGDNAVTKILKELTVQLEALKKLIAATNYGNKDMGSVVVLGLEEEVGAVRRNKILSAVIGAVGRGGVGIDEGKLVEGLVSSLHIGDNSSYDEEVLRDWDEELLESLNGIVYAFSSEDNLDAALDDGIFSDEIISSSYMGAGENEPLLTTKDVFDVVPSEVNAVFDYTEYTRFGLWTSETIASAASASNNADVKYEVEKAASTTDTGRYAYSPLGNTGLTRADLPSKVKGSYEGYTYATAADLTIYSGDLTITIDWSDTDATADTTAIEVMISDLTDSDGMGWTDFAGNADDDAKDPTVASITFGRQTGTQLVAFSSDTGMEKKLDSPSETIVAENVAGFNKGYNGGLDYDEVIKLVYDDGDEAYASGGIAGQFLGVRAADSGNSDQPRAIIGNWYIGAMRKTADTVGGRTILEARKGVNGVDNGSNGSTLEGVYGADLVVP